MAQDWNVSGEFQPLYVIKSSVKVAWVDQAISANIYSQISVALSSTGPGTGLFRQIQQWMDELAPILAPTVEKAVG